MSTYIDTTVFIFTVLDGGSRKENAGAILEKISGSKERYFTSVLTLDEVLWVLWKETKDRRFAIEHTEKILQIPNLSILGVSSLDFTTSLSILEKYATLKPRDALHISVAKNNHLTHIISDDKDFDCVEEIKRLPV